MYGTVSYGALLKLYIVSFVLLAGVCTLLTLFLAHVCHRTTPRADCLSESGDVATRAEYVEAIVAGVREAEAEAEAAATAPGIVVRLLLSIDRSDTLDAAEEIVALAAEYASPDLHGGIVVGVDFSGNPNNGKFADFVPILSKARLQYLLQL